MVIPPTYSDGDQSPIAAEDVGVVDVALAGCKVGADGCKRSARRAACAVEGEPCHTLVLWEGGKVGIGAGREREREREREECHFEQREIRH